MHRPSTRPGTAIAAVTLALSAACSGGSDHGAANDASAPVDLRKPRDLLPTPVGAVQGAILDEDGSPHAGASVLCCSARECPAGIPTGSDGSFTIGRLLLTQRMVKVLEDATATPRLGETIAPVLLDADGVTIDVGNLYLPRMGAGADIADVGTPQELAGATSKSPIAVKAPAIATPGTPVRFRSVSDLDGSLGDPVPGLAPIDGSVSTEKGKGISLLTWLVVSTPL